ncbi:ErfK/YbiS/YcfS/YnhG family protein [Rhodomicrobium vannielii ATCC 17100]|uniref:ErfK/YbiS/YcfS/YnhG family protein n=1 Tax=Rhodomicrobium vannielii (strain ATCC 17100 / DSM 162 / LMG 4299 / NCIMB 10020 / ATH 3.1.1) TaxID=648757 RepID=E3HZP8_RHOVT|nr:L,D-transpeptidase family protein [Rhodomicrobium vannielii]ADP72158.1 ErfK/YbiS/YcfS/YnhG family protein [Rhodomicrobium vannielii ATCC 17100]
MTGRAVFVLFILSAMAFASPGFSQEQQTEPGSPVEAALEGDSAASTEDAPAIGLPPSENSPAVEVTAAPAPLTPQAEALRKALLALPAGADDEERNERAALLSFYETRRYAPLWFAASGVPTPKAGSLAAEIARAADYGLAPSDFALPAGLDQRVQTAATHVGDQKPEAIASDEIDISRAVLKYGRFARGGRITNPSEQLSSYLDRRPQLLKPEAILDGVAATDEPDAYLRGLHPQHVQFERLRQKYLALRDKKQSAEAKRLLANMEQWRWMPADLGDLYVWNNIPEYTQRVVKNGEVVRKERIVTGQLDKQTPVFTRTLKKITFKPTWIVPESIKVREILPSLQRGGGMMREWQLELRDKDGQTVDWRRINWYRTDIRIFNVVQPNGAKSVMGKVKFSFPSQHTVFMHDAYPPDKWMFNKARRTYSHGCMRVQNPIGLAEILLKEDKGFEAAQVRDAVRTGGNDNEFDIERRIPIHMTYFTALVGDDGKLHTFPDVYGHERRITLALEGKWSQISRGKDHLAPVELQMVSEQRRSRYAEDDSADAPPRVWRNNASFRGGFLDSLFGRW